MKEKLDLYSMSTLPITIFGVFVILFSPAVFAQSSPQYVLLDEFGTVACGDLLARTDNLLNHQSRDSAASAIVIITSEKGKDRVAQSRYRLISSSLDQRDLPIERVRYLKAPAESDTRTQFWLVPEGVKMPAFDGVPWPQHEYDTSKRFLFDSVDELEYCTTFVPKRYAELLRKHPKAVGRIVVFEGRSSVPGNLFAKRWLDELVGKQKIPRQRLKVSFRKTKNLTYAQFWFVP